MREWLTPTIRSSPLDSFAYGVGGAMMLAALARLGGASDPVLVDALAALFAAIGCQALQDPAWRFVAAMPTTARIRGLRRGMVVGSATIVALVVARLAAEAIGAADVMPGIGPILALGTSGWAVAALVDRARPDVGAAIGASTIVAWVSVPRVGGYDTAVATAWSDHPVAVTGLASLTALGLLRT